MDAGQCYIPHHSTVKVFVKQGCSKAESGQEKLCRSQQHYHAHISWLASVGISVRTKATEAGQNAGAGSPDKVANSLLGGSTSKTMLVPCKSIRQQTRRLDQQHGEVGGARSCVIGPGQSTVGKTLGA